MAKVEGVCREVLEKTEWVAIVTRGDDGPHLVATWGDYVRTLGIRDGEILIAPAGEYHKTEENLRNDSRVELLMASKQVRGGKSIGRGCWSSGTAEVQTSGEFVEMAKAKFPWARGALVIKVEETRVQL